MTALHFLNDTPQRAFRKLEADLALVNSELNLRRYKNMTPRSLNEEISHLEQKRRRMVSESTYGAWLKDEKYVEMKLLYEALTFLKNHKEEQKEHEVLVPGFTYYRRVKQFGPILEGQKCYFREGDVPVWAQFKMPIAIAKAFEVMRHGSEDDFKKIYIEMADGRLDALENVTLEHLTESSKDSLKSIESYCDQRWSGPWAWDIPSPYSLRESIEERVNMALKNVTEMQVQFSKLVTRLNEDEMDKYAVIAAAEEMSDTIEKMVQQIARLGGEGIITLKDQIRVTMGNDAAAQIEDKFLDPVRNAADALSQLRAVVDNTVENLKSTDQGDGLGGGMGDELGGDAMGTPEDALGGDFTDDDALAGDLADVSVDGEDGERPMKME